MARRVISALCIVVSVAAFAPASAQPRAFICRGNASLTWYYYPDNHEYAWTINGHGICKASNTEAYTVSFSGSSPVNPTGSNTGLCGPDRSIGFGASQLEVGLTLTRTLDGSKSYDSQKWAFGDGFNPPLGTNPGVTLFTVGRLAPFQTAKHGAGVLTSTGCNPSGTPAQIIWVFTPSGA